MKSKKRNPIERKNQNKTIFFPLPEIAPFIRYVGTAQLPPEGKYQNTHIGVEICYICSGKGKFCQKKDIRFNFRKGDIFIIKAQREFIIQAACGEKLKFYFLGIDFAEIVRNKANNSLTKEEDCILVFKQIYKKCNAPFKDRFNFGLLLQKLYQEIDEKKVGHLTLAKGYFLECISLLARIICEGKVRQGETSFRRSYKKIERVIDFIEKNYSQKLSLQTLSNKVHLSPYHFSRIFKEYTAYSPIQYMNLIRIEKAKELLSKRKILHRHIAKKIGFDNPYYFSRTFKNLAGLSPLQYEKSVREIHPSYKTSRKFQ